MQTAPGYRAVTLNLRFVGAAAGCLGLTHHVCELVLVHLSVAVCLTDEQHGAYLQARFAKPLAGQEEATPWRSWLGLQRAAALGPEAGSFSMSHLSEHPTPPRTPLPRSPLRAAAALGFSGSQQALPRAAPGSEGLGPGTPPAVASQEVVLHPVQLDKSHGADSPGGEVHSGERCVEARSASQDGTASRSNSWSRLESGGAEAAWQAELEAAGRECRVPGRVLLEQYRLRTMLLGPAELYESAPSLRESVDQCRALSVFSTSFPIAAAMRKTIFPLFWLMVACATGYALPLWPAELAGTARAQLVAFKALQLRSAASPPSAPVIEELQLHHRGCAVLHQHSVNVSADYLTYTLAFDGEVLFDEVVFRTPAHGGLEHDPVTFAIEGSLDGVEWWPLAASRKVLLYAGGVRFDRARVDLPEERGRAVVVSLWAPWYVGERLADLLIVAYALLIAVLSLLCKYEWGRPATIALPVLLGLQATLSGVARSVQGYYFVFPVDYLKALVSFASAGWLLVREGQVLAVVLTNAFMYMLIDYLDRLFDERRDLARVPLATSAVIGMCLALMALKWRHQHLTFADIRDDVALYDQAWQEVLADPEQRADCQRIAAALERVQFSQRPRQCYSVSCPSADVLEDMFDRMTSVLSHSISRNGSRGPSQPLRPVKTLGLLYRHAAGVHSLAQRKLQEWCEVSPTGAMLPIKLEDGTVELVPVAGFETRRLDGGEGGHGSGWEEAAQRLPPLKSVDRASQKLMRAYAAEASLLLDLCRFCLVFDHARQLADLVQLIRIDREVTVVGFKNRMREGYNTRQSAGFRDVHLNLVMRTAEAERLGVGGHVWELQLMLTPFCKLRSEGGHARYVRYRDSRAE